MAQAQTKVQEWKYDRFASTFKHIIHQINPDGTYFPMTGYSKPDTRAEKYDKIENLKGMITRFVNTGYLFGVHKKYASRTEKMEWFLNGRYTGEPDELIFTLYPDEYVFEKNPEYVMDTNLNTFLKRLYEQAKTGEILQKTLRRKPQGATQEQILDMSKGRFKNEPELYSFMQDCIRRELVPHGRIHKFYIDYRNKWFV